MMSVARRMSIPPVTDTMLGPSSRNTTPKMYASGSPILPTNAPLPAGQYSEPFAIEHCAQTAKNCENTAIEVSDADLNRSIVPPVRSPMRTENTPNDSTEARKRDCFAKERSVVHCKALRVAAPHPKTTPNMLVVSSCLNGSVAMMAPRRLKNAAVAMRGLTDSCSAILPNRRTITGPIWFC